MEKLKNNELEEIKGGELGTLAVICICAAVVFIAGVIEGIAHPKKCGST